MKITDIVAIVAIVLNIVTLGFVIYQSIITRKSFDTAKNAFQEDIKIRRASILPKATYIIHVNIKIKIWLEMLEALSDELSIAIKDNNFDAIVDVGKKYYKPPKGIVESFYYVNSPEWISEIYLSCAKHYNMPIGHLAGLRENYNREVVMSSAGGIVITINESICYIEELKLFIKNSIPQAYLDAPEHLSADKYLSD